METIVKEINARTVIPSERCKFTWSVENISLFSHNLEKELWSPQFTTGTSFLTTWNLMLEFTNGSNDNSDCFMGVYLNRNSNDTSHHIAIHTTHIKSASNDLIHTFNSGTQLYTETDNCFGTDKMISRKLFFGKNKHQLIPNDILTLVCELVVHRVSDTEVNEVLKPDSLKDTAKLENLPSFSSDFTMLYNDKTLSDLVVKVGKEEIRCHKVILAARSPVFLMMLRSEMKESMTNCIEISDFEAVVIQKMLTFIYSGKLEEVNPQIVIQLFHAAMKYEILDMKTILLTYLLSHLSVDNAYDIFQLGKLYDELKLVDAARNFIRLNYAYVYESDNWKTLGEAFVSELNPYTILKKKIESKNSVPSLESTALVTPEIKKDYYQWKSTPIWPVFTDQILGQRN